MIPSSDVLMLGYCHRPRELEFSVIERKNIGSIGYFYFLRGMILKYQTEAVKEST